MLFPNEEREDTEEEKLKKLNVDIFISYFLFATTALLFLLKFGQIFLNKVKPRSW